MSEKNKQFAKEIYDAAVGTDVSPLFITAQACFETGWGKSKIGEYNLWGIKAPQTNALPIELLTPCCVKEWSRTTDARAFSPSRRSTT